MEKQGFYVCNIKIHELVLLPRKRLVEVSTEHTQKTVAAVLFPSFLRPERIPIVNTRCPAHWSLTICSIPKGYLQSGRWQSTFSSSSKSFFSFNKKITISFYMLLDYICYNSFADLTDDVNQWCSLELTFPPMAHLQPYTNLWLDTQQTQRDCSKLLVFFRVLCDI